MDFNVFIRIEQLMAAAKKLDFNQMIGKTQAAHDYTMIA